jgi:hypothetical protein
LGVDDRLATKKATMRKGARMSFQRTFPLIVSCMIGGRSISLTVTTHGSRAIVCFLEVRANAGNVGVERVEAIAPNGTCSCRENGFSPAPILFVR